MTDIKRYTQPRNGCNSVMAGAHEVPRDQIFPPARWVRERWRKGQNVNVLDLDENS